MGDHDMNESLYEVSFSGQIQEGAELDVVKARIGKMFKADEATIAKLFSGKRIVIKKNLSAETADKYSIAFTKAGAICDLALMPEDSAPSPADDRAATKTPPPASAAPADRDASSKQGFRKTATISAVAIVVLAALVGATPYVTGMLAEQKYQDGMVLFQDFAMQQSGAFTVKSDVDYQRGWLSSTVINTITLEVPEQDPVTFELNSNISHGPLLLSGPEKFGLAAIDTRMPLSAAQKADMAKIWKSDENPIRIQSHIDFDGKTLIEVSIARFTLDNIDNDPAGKLNFETMSTTFTLSEHFTRTDVDMSWNGMQLDTADVKVVVGKFTGHSEKQLSEGLWLGDDELNLSSVSFNLSGPLADSSGQMPSSSTIEKLGMVAHSEVDSGNLVKGHTTITVKDVAVENKSVARDFKLSIAVERLQAKALQGIAQKMNEYQKLAIQSGNPGQAPGLALVQNEVAEILAAGPVLKITTLQATTEHGKVEADLEATIKVGDLAALQNPLFLMMATQAAGNVSVPARLIENTPLAIYAPGFIAQGYINSEQGQLKTSMKFRQGQLTLNGKALQQ